MDQGTDPMQASLVSRLVRMVRDEYATIVNKLADLKMLRKAWVTLRRPAILSGNGPAIISNVISRLAPLERQRERAEATAIDV